MYSEEILDFSRVRDCTYNEWNIIFIGVYKYGSIFFHCPGGIYGDGTVCTLMGRNSVRTKNNWKSKYLVAHLNQQLLITFCPMSLHVHMTWCRDIVQNLYTILKCYQKVRLLFYWLIEPITKDLSLHKQNMFVNLNLTSFIIYWIVDQFHKKLKVFTGKIYLYVVV